MQSSPEAMDSLATWNLYERFTVEYRLFEFELRIGHYDSCTAAESHMGFELLSATENWSGHSLRNGNFVSHNLYQIITLVDVVLFSACVSAGVRIRSSVDFSTKSDVTYSAADMGLWCIAEMVSGFFILCLPSIPKLFRDSRWINVIVTTFRSSSSRLSFFD